MATEGWLIVAARYRNANDPVVGNIAFPLFCDAAGTFDGDDITSSASMPPLPLT